MTEKSKTQNPRHDSQAPGLMNPISKDFEINVFLSGCTVCTFHCSASVKAPLDFGNSAA